jgi:tetratricopeptide (TPR) repeat protein
MKQYKNAIDCYDKAIAINPTDPRVHNNKGVSLMALQKFEEALQCFDAAVALDATHIDALVNRAFALVRCEKFGDALLAYDKILQKEPTNIGAWYVTNSPVALDMGFVTLASGRARNGLVAKSVSLC